jgi:hypothetical protein
MEAGRARSVARRAGDARLCRRGRPYPASTLQYWTLKYD